MKKIIILVLIITIVTIFLLNNNSLSKLGYTKKEINFIKENFTKEEIEKYLSDKKYTSLINYKKSSSFNIENLNRYEAYKEKNEDFTDGEIVTYVEIGLDKEFYTNIKEVTNFNNKLCLVNKYNKLPDGFVADALVTLDKQYSSNSQKMNKEAAENMIALIDNAKELGHSLDVISGYRTEEYQNTLFTSSIKRNGIDHALIYSAKPGHSEHQTGFAADLNSTLESFANTKEYIFLKENAYKYGYIERYSKGKEFITGYAYEPWHYRYVGAEAATIIHKENITLEEYLLKYFSNK